VITESWKCFGLEQSWLTGWDAFVRSFDRIEIPNIKFGVVSLSKQQKERNITPVIPVSAREASLRLAKSALFMTETQRQNYFKFLHDERSLDGWDFDFDGMIARAEAKILPDKIDFAPTDLGLTIPPFGRIYRSDFRYGLERPYDIDHRVLGSPFIFLRLNSRHFAGQYDSALNLIHELWHKQQYESRPAITESGDAQADLIDILKDRAAKEADAYLLTYRVLSAAYYSRNEKFKESPELAKSVIIAYGQFVERVIKNEDLGSGSVSDQVLAGLVPTMSTSLNKIARMKP
jgi:hypothetical protein